MKKAFILLLYLFSTSLFGESLIITEDSLSLKNKGLYTIDKEKEITIEKLVNGQEMKENPVKDFGIMPGQLWSRFTLKSQDSGVYVIFSRWQKAHLVHFYLVQNGQIIESAVTGESVSLILRSIPYRRPAFSFFMEKGKEYDIYISIESRSNLYRDFSIMKNGHFFQYSLNDEWFLFFYFGVIGVLAFYNLMVSISSRDIDYLFYSIYIFFMLMYQVAVEGYGNHYLWPEWTWFKPRSYNFFICISYIAGVLFTRSYLNLKIFSPSFNLFGRVIILLFIFTGLSFLFTYSEWQITLGTICIFIGMLFLLSSGILALSNRYKPARFYVAAWSCLVIGTFITTGRRLHWFPDTRFTEYAIHWGTMLEAILLALGLGYRVRYYLKQKLEAEEALIEANSKILQNRMKPHFLFNSMNIIFSQLRESPDQAQNTLRRLSENYHFLTESENRPIIPLREEWDFLINYIELMKQRWPDKLKINSYLSDELKNLPVPPVILQPLAENAFKYGLKNLEEKKLDIIALKSDENKVIIKLSNRKTESLNNVDYSRTLGNIQNRLKRYYSDAELKVYEEGEMITSRIQFNFPGA